MLTGSEDGLMCFFDTEVSLEEDVSILLQRMTARIFFLALVVGVGRDEAQGRARRPR